MIEMTVWLAPLAAAIRIALGLLFLQAAWGKTRDAGAFSDIVLNYRLLPRLAARPAAAALVVAEYAAAALSLSGMQQHFAGGLSASLFALFTVAMAVNLLRGRADISCGCLPAYAARASLSWMRVTTTALLIPLALLAGAAWPVSGMATLAQADLAGLLLFTLYDAAVRLAATPRVGARS